MGLHLVLSSPLTAKATHQTRLDKSLAGKRKLVHSPTTAEPVTPTLASSRRLDFTDTHRLLLSIPLLLYECLQPCVCVLAATNIMYNLERPSISSFLYPLDSSYLFRKYISTVIRCSTFLNSSTPNMCGALTAAATVVDKTPGNAYWVGQYK